MDFGTEILFNIITCVLGLLVGILFGILKTKIHNEQKEDTAIKNGLRCLLREEIIRICDRCLERGSVHIHCLESLDDLFEQYSALGGNGMAKKLIEDVKKLKVQ